MSQLAVRGAPTRSRTRRRPPPSRSTSGFRWTRSSTALGRVGTAAWRMELPPRDDGVVVLNDAYNASPSVDARRARHVRPARRCPGGASRCSARCASSARSRRPSTPGVGELVAAGRRRACSSRSARAPTSSARPRPARGVEVQRVADRDAAIARAAAPSLAPGDAVLVKASRLVGLEHVADALLAAPGARVVIAVLIAVSVAFVVSVLGTPVPDPGPARPQHRPADPRRRPDRPPARAQGRHARRWAGIAIIVAAFVGYLASHIRTEAIKFADTAIALWFLILGLAFVGWLDDYLGVRRARNLGLRKRGKTGGILIVTVGLRAARAPVRQRLDAPVVHPPARPRPRHRRLVPVGDRRGLRDRRTR